MSIHAPGPVRAAFFLWVTALSAGVLETALMISANDVAGAGLVAPLAIRTLVTVLFAFVAVRMLAGRRWARIVLAVLLGVLGTLSLVFDPVRWLLAGNSIPDALAAAGALDLTFGVVRAVHIVSVLTAVPLMFGPGANRYFRGH